MESEISTHSLTRRLTLTYIRLYSIFVISTHSLTRRLTPVGPCGPMILPISTHSLTRRLTVLPALSSWKAEYFNSQPHKEADSTAHHRADTIDISTHSLTRRLTNDNLNGAVTLLFQLTASQGGWHTRRSREHGRNYFNSQPHKEADDYTRYENNRKSYFNSQPHKEADVLFHLMFQKHWYFNSQPHKEADVVFQDIYKVFQHFNSQPHKEADMESDISCI